MVKVPVGPEHEADPSIGRLNLNRIHVMHDDWPPIARDKNKPPMNDLRMSNALHCFHVHNMPYGKAADHGATQDSVINQAR